MSDNVRPWDLLNPNKPKSTKDLKDYRMDICTGCEHFIKITKQCSKCGCFMELKTKLEEATCPVGKW